MNDILIQAPAKVNTLLRVIGRRENGYHDLQMVMVPLTLADEIELSSAKSGIELTSDGAGDAGMMNEKNLVWRAAKLFIENAKIDKGIRIHLNKKIPIAAGLGGGSSDAAAVLIGLNRLWDLNWPVSKLAEIGVKLGADVPFFCHGGPAFVGGIGDEVTPYKTFPNLSFLLINPGFSVPTPWVYKQWDLLLTVKAADAKNRPLFKALGDVVVSLHNDLEKVTIPAYPEVADIKKFLIGTGAAGALMSGSGPTVFGVFEDSFARDRAMKVEMPNSWRAFAAEFEGKL